MAKRQLLVWMREKLGAHVDATVEPARQKKTLDAAYAKASTAVRKIVEAKYPPAEMKVLQKHKCSHPYSKIKVQYPNGVVQQFEFAASDAPEMPDRYEVNNRIYLIDATCAAAVEKWAEASEAYKAERKKRIDAYRALLQGAKYVEDLVDVWPEAASLLPKHDLPIALGPEQIAVVKSDLRERKAA